MRQTMRQNIPWFFRGTLAVLCLNALTVSARTEEKIIGEEMIKKWKAYERFARSIQGTERLTNTWESGKVRRIDAVYKQNHDCVLRCYVDGEKPTEHCELANPHYAARLKRSKIEQSKTVLERFSEDSPDLSTTIFTACRHSISPHFSVFDTPLSQFAKGGRYTSRG